MADGRKDEPDSELRDISDLSAVETRARASRPNSAGRVILVCAILAVLALGVLAMVGVLR